MSTTEKQHFYRRLPITPLPLPLPDDRAKDGRKVILFTFDGRCFAAHFEGERWVADEKDHDHFYGIPITGWLPFPA